MAFKPPVPSTIAAFTVATLLTFAAGATFKFTNQQPNAPIFTDANQNATTSVDFKVTTSTQGTALLMTGSATNTFVGAVSSSRFMANAGSMTQPGFAFTANPNTGMFGFGGQLRIASLGGLSAVFDNTSFNSLHVYPLTNATYDIGAPTLNYRNAYLGTIYASSTAGGTSSINATGTVQVTGNSGATIQMCGGASGACTALATAQMGVNPATGLFSILGTGSNTDLNLGARNGGVMVITNADVSPNSGKGTDTISFGTNSLRWGIGHFASVSSTNVTGTKVYVNNVTTGRAACFKADKSLGFCSSTVGAAGDCTCN